MIILLMRISYSDFTKKVHSISTNRLIKVKKNLDANNFLYFGETPEKRIKFFRSAHRSPIQPASEFYAFLGPESLDPRSYLKSVESRRKLTPTLTSSNLKNVKAANEARHNFFKRKIIREKSAQRIDVEKPEFFIEHLVSVPLGERRSSERKINNPVQFLHPKPVTKIEYKSIKTNTKETIKNKENPPPSIKTDELILYCDPLTIDDTESPSPIFKPRYL